MIIGNQQSKSLLQTYINNGIGGQSKVSFFLLNGPKNIGKSSIALELITKLLGQYTANDLLHIKDFSDILGKPHSIKVEENNTTEDYKLLNSTHQYRDIGIREINQRLQKSSFGKAKVLLIENIERMTTQAANAFLKACEEPLPNRIIIVTCSNKSRILDTILSRAILIPFVELTNTEMKSIANDSNIFPDHPELQEIIITMAMGRPGAMLAFNNLITNDEKLKDNIQKLLTILPHPGHLLEKQQMLSKFIEDGIIDQFIDAWIAYTTNHFYTSQAKKWLAVKKLLLESNVNVDNAILYGLLD